MLKSEYHVLGVMSGTSLDGIDLAEVFFSVSEEGSWTFKIGSSETIGYSDVWRTRLGLGVHYSKADLDKLDHDFTLLLGEVMSNFISKNGIKDLDAVCSHGHTILHRPEQGITLQIGNLPKLSELVKETIVCDFRVQDVALGGQGAPLVPIGDRMLFSQFDYCLNLGGFANVSMERDGQRVAYDICPVNIVLNQYAETLGHPFDEGGKIAASGIVHDELLQKLNTLPYYFEPGPKSLGLEWVEETIFPILNASEVATEDILATFTEHIAFQLAAQFLEGSSVLITGGGAYNDFMVNRLQVHRNVRTTIPSSEIIEYKEALVFGLLGVLKLRGEVNCLASVTGAKHDHSSGKVFAG